MLGYDAWSNRDAKEFGHWWAEAIVAGEFRVADVQDIVFDSGWQHNREERSAHRVRGKVVTLEPLKYFDPKDGWRDV